MIDTKIPQIIDQVETDDLLDVIFSRYKVAAMIYTIPDNRKKNCEDHRVRIKGGTDGVRACTYLTHEAINMKEKEMI